MTERGQIHSITTDLLPKMAPCLLTWMKLDYPAYIWKRWHFYPEKQVHSLFFCWVCLIARTHKYKKIENKCLKKYVNQHFEELRSYKPTVKTGVNAFCCFEFDLWPSNTRFFFFFSFYLLIPQTVIKMCEPNTNKEMSGYIFYHCISAKTTTRINPRYVPQPVVPLAAGAVNERLSDNNILKL